MVGIFPGIPNVLEIIVIAAGLSLLTTYVYKFLTFYKIKDTNIIMT